MHVFEHSCGGKGGGEGGGGDGGGEGGGGDGGGDGGGGELLWSCATQTLLSSSSSVAIEPRMELARRPAGSERASDQVCLHAALFPCLLFFGQLASAQCAPTMK